MSRPAQALPDRVPIGTTPSLRGRLALQRPRPALVRLYAALLGEAGLVGPWARRRFLAFALRSL
ncbi:MAG TPA: hypothetical protein VIV57_03475, partial [Anaeromyxobacter sp.]